MAPLSLHERPALGRAPLHSNTTPKLQLQVSGAVEGATSVVKPDPDAPQDHGEDPIRERKEQLGEQRQTTAVPKSEQEPREATPPMPEIRTKREYTVREATPIQPQQDQKDTEGDVAPDGPLSRIDDFFDAAKEEDRNSSDDGFNFRRARKRDADNIAVKTEGADAPRLGQTLDAQPFPEQVRVSFDIAGRYVPLVRAIQSLCGAGYSNVQAKDVQAVLGPTWLGRVGHTLIDHYIDEAVRAGVPLQTAQTKKEDEVILVSLTCPKIEVAAGPTGPCFCLL